MDILAEIKHRPPCHVDMDGVRPAVPGHPYIVLLDEQERDNLVAEIERLRAVLAQWEKVARAVPRLRDEFNKIVNEQLTK